MSCLETRSQFSAYLDGAVSGAEMHAIATHMEECGECAAEFAEWREMQRMLASAAAAKPPADMGLRLRVAISQERARTTRHRLDVWQMRWQNTVAPMLARGAAGLVTALILVGALGLMIGTVAAAPPTVAANESMADRTSTPQFLYTVGASDSRVTFRNPVVVQADVNESGRVYAYRILSGPRTEAVREQLDNFLLMSHFTPAQVYGMPVPGHAVLSFSGVYRHHG